MPDLPLHLTTRVTRCARAIVFFLTAAVALSTAHTQRLDFAEQRDIAPGARLHHVRDGSLLDPPAAISIWLLRLDPSRILLRAALANDEILGTETVADIAERHHAVAAINAGFFAPNGDPSGLLTLNGQLVSDTRKPRGAVGIVTTSGGVHLLFGRLRASLALEIQNRSRPPVTLAIQGVDTQRIRGLVMLYTPAYHDHTNTAPGGREWTFSGSPLRVTGGVRTEGNTPIPRDGFVLSFRGAVVPSALKQLTSGTRTAVTTRYDPLDDAGEEWSRATDAVGGAGLLIRDGRDLDWSIEDFKAGFAENRHPRTMIGTERDGTIWLVTVDGRQPQLSAGMTLEELRTLAHRLDLTNALNLDGGGSTTMWVEGQIVNSPSDTTGPRKVSDALLVFAADAEKRGGALSQ